MVTLDNDFGELAVLHGTPRCGILRLVGVAAKQQAAVCRQVRISYSAELAAGAIITADAVRLRIRVRRANGRSAALTPLNDCFLRRVAASLPATSRKRPRVPFWSFPDQEMPFGSGGPQQSCKKP